ncbi:MAG: hypothetical protein CFE21_13470 [Bacteroidetes bacterium B1(2017)]|nr:MAG: hypothetical protein CFE21_13470 [Bacteroidetes bacterium B1(2017)]
MPKALKVILITLLILVSLFGTLFIYVYQNIDELKKYALKEVNQMLTAELTAKSIDVTVFKTFPKVSLALNQVSIADPIRANKKLLQAEHLFLGFDILDVLNSNYKIHLISLDSGSVFLYTNGKGKTNYDILKETEAPSKKKKPFSFQLNKLELTRMSLEVQDLQSNFSTHTYLQESSLSGSFTDKRFTMDIALKGNSKFIQSGSLTFFKDKEIGVQTSLDIDQENNKYQFIKGNFTVNQLILDLTGYIQNSKNQTEYQLGFKANKLSIQDLLSTLPVSLPEAMNAYQSSGNVFFEGSIKGIQTANQNPQVKINFGIDQGSLVEPDSKMKLEQISLKGSFDNGKSGSLEDAVIAIPTFNAILVGSKINGNLTVSNLQSPTLNLDLNGEADLNTLHTFFKFADVKEIGGNVQFTLTLKGEKKGEGWDWSSPFNKGIFALQLDKLKLNYLTKALEKGTIKAELNNNSLTLSQADFVINKSDLKATGTFPGFMDFLVKKGASLNGSISLSSAFLDIDDILIYDSSDPREEGEQALDYTISLKANANQFVYGNFNANNFKMEAILKPDLIEFNNANLSTCGGTFSGNGQWIMQNNLYVLKSSNQAKGLNINELLKQFNNFGQTEFTSQNLNGSLSASTDLLVVWDSKMNLISDKMLVVTDMSIKNGELINYEPLNSLSKFVDVNELKNLKFSELKNTLTIKDKMLTIPTMDIRNNALNLNLTGVHSFENVLDYKIKLSLSELLSKKRKPQSNEFGEEDEKTRGINLFLTIKGPISDLKFVFDRKGAKAQLKQDAKQEKENIKEILKQEFGIKKDSTLKKVEKNENNDELEFEAN